MKSKKYEALAGSLTTAQGVIVEELKAIPEFRRKITDLAHEFRDMADKKFEYPIDLMIIYSEVDENDTVALGRLIDYVSQLRSLAEGYNLRCDWIIQGFHYMVKSIVYPEHLEPITNYYLAWEIDRFRLDVPVLGTTRKEDILREVDKEWERLKREHPELRSRVRVPEKLEQHVRWLCLRLFYNKRADEIEPEMGKTSDYISYKIRTTAKLLGIRLLRGRPPGSKNRIV